MNHENRLEIRTLVGTIQNALKNMYSNMIVYMDRMRRAQNDDDQKDMNDRGAQEFVRVHGIQVNNH